MCQLANSFKESDYLPPDVLSFVKGITAFCDKKDISKPVHGGVTRHTLIFISLMDQADSTAKPYKSVTKVPSKQERRPPGSAIKLVIAKQGTARLKEKTQGLLAAGKHARTEFDGMVFDCVLCPGALNADGYQQVNILSANKATDEKQETAYLHHLVHWCHSDQILNTWDMSIAHVCHHPDCIHPDHLVMEELWRNVCRQTCPGFSACMCHDTAKCLLPGYATLS